MVWPQIGFTFVNPSVSFIVGDAISWKALQEGGRRPGWRWEPGSGHVWATLYCPLAARDGCQVRVHSTPQAPQDPGSHAKRIRGEVDACQH